MSNSYLNFEHNFANKLIVNQIDSFNNRIKRLKQINPHVFNEEIIAIEFMEFKQDLCDCLQAILSGQKLIIKERIQEEEDMKSREKYVIVSYEFLYIYELPIGNIGFKMSLGTFKKINKYFE